MGALMGDDCVQLWRTRKADIPFVLEAERACENAEYVGQWSLEQHERALDDADILHMIIRDADGRNAGYVIMRGMNNPNDSVELMRIVVTQKRLGYGSRALALIREWCFERKGAHRLWLDVRAHNARAQHVYAAQGFVREGLLRECVKVGNEYQSLIVMSILRE